MKRIRSILVLGLGLILGAFLVTFTLFNRDVVLVDFYPATPLEIPIAGVAALGFGIGALLVGLGTALLKIRSARELKVLRGRFETAREELKRLRNAPLAGELESSKQGDVLTSSAQDHD